MEKIVLLVYASNVSKLVSRGFSGQIFTKKAAFFKIKYVIKQ